LEVLTGFHGRNVFRYPSIFTDPIGFHYIQGDLIPYDLLSQNLTSLDKFQRFTYKLIIYFYKVDLDLFCVCSASSSQCGVVSSVRIQRWVLHSQIFLRSELG